MTGVSKKQSRRSPEEWRRLISEQQSSGLSVSRFARERGLSVASLTYWRAKLRGETSPACLPRPAKGVFAEVVVVPRGTSSVSRVEVVTRNGRSVRVEGSVDANLLREVLRVVESC